MLCSQWLVTGVTCNDVRRKRRCGRHVLNGSQIKRRVKSVVNDVEVRPYNTVRYKMFTKIITTRLVKKLDENQPREQAGFRSTLRQITYAINQLKEKYCEYNIPCTVCY